MGMAGQDAGRHEAPGPVSNPRYLFSKDPAMTKLLSIPATALAFAILGLSLSAPDAYAGARDTTHHRGQDHYQRDYDRRDRHTYRDRYDRHDYRDRHDVRDRRHYRDRRHHRDHRSSTSVRYRNDGFSFSVRVGDNDHYKHRRHSRHGHDRHYRSRHHDKRHYGNRHHHKRHVRYHTPHRKVYTQRTVVINNHHGGYWKRVYVEPVYQTRYYSCGTPYRVSIRAGYWKKVWVSAGVRY